MYRQFLDGFKFSTLAVALIFSLQPLHAHAAATWDGEAGDGDWSTPANWDGDLLPNPDAEIILPASSGIIHITPSAAAQVDNSLEIGSGTTLVVDLYASLTLDGIIVGQGELINYGFISQGPNASGKIGQANDFFAGDLFNGGTIDGVTIHRGFYDSVFDNAGTLRSVSVILGGSGVLLNNYGAIVDSNVDIFYRMYSSSDTRPRLDNLPGGTITGGGITAGEYIVGVGYGQGALHNQGSIVGTGIDVLTEFINHSSGTIDLAGGYLRVRCYGYRGDLLAQNFGTISGGTITNYCSVWYGEGDGTSWSDPLNWSMGIVPTGQSEVKIFTESGESAVVHLDTDLTVSQTMYFAGPDMTLVIDPGSNLILGTGTPGSRKLIDMRKGAIINNGFLVNNDRLDSGYSGIAASASTIQNNGTLENYGTLNNFSGSSFVSEGSLQNNGTFNNWGSFESRSTGAIFNGGEIYSYCGASYLDEGVLTGSPPIFLCAVWDGEAGDGNWSTPANWEGDLLPNPDAEIVLPALSGDIHVTDTATAQVDNSLEIGSGTTLIVDLYARLTLDGIIVGQGDLINSGLISQGTNVSGEIGDANNFFSGYLLNEGTIDGVSIHRGFRDSVFDNAGTLRSVSVILGGSGVLLNNYGDIDYSNVDIFYRMYSSSDTRPRLDNLPGGTITRGGVTAGEYISGVGYGQGALHNQGSIVGTGIDVLTEFINHSSGTIDLAGGYLRVRCYGYRADMLAKNFGTISGGTITNYCSVWYGEGDGASWSDPLNWSMGIVPTGQSEVKIYTESGESAVVHLDTDLTVSQTMSLVGPDLTLLIDPGVALVLDTGFVGLSKLIDLRRGTIINNGLLVNHDRLDSGYSGIAASASTIQNNGTLENHGKLNNFEGSVIYNLGTLDSTVGSVENYGSIDNQCGGTVVGTINQNPVDYASCDTTPPVITVPPDITVEATSDAGAAVEFVATAFDETDGAITPSCSLASGALFAIGMTPVTCTAADSAGNAASATFYVTVVDTTPPTLTVPADIIVDATAPAGAIVTFAADAADNVGVVSLACAPASGTPFPIGTTVVTCTAADAAGNTATALFNVTVIDVFPPTLTVPADIVAEATGPAGAIVSFAADAADNIGVASLVCAPASGGMFALGTTAVTCTAADAAGNTATASFSVTIIDTTPPSLTVPADIVADATSPTGAIVTFSADAADNVGVVSLACAPASGTEFPLGATVVTCTAVDAAGNTAVASFNVTVVNVAPVANDDYVVTDEDTALIIDVLANDNDANGDMLTVTSVSTPSHGTAIINPDGTITYTPAANFNGSDSLTYEVSDGNGGAASATVYITVEAVNDAPQAVDDATSTLEDVPVIIPVLANDSDLDGDAMIVVAAGNGDFGTASTDGVTVTYFPAAHAYGADTLTYQIGDGKGGYAEAIVTIEVIPVNDPPAAIDDNAITDEDTGVTVDVLANDSDTEGDPLTVTSVSTPSNGMATINPDGTITYTPLQNFNGSDSLTYAVSDGNGGAATAMVNITVNPVNDAPDVSVDLSSQSVQYSDGIAVVTISASDIDSASLSLTPSGLPAGTAVGAASCAPSGAGTTCSWQLSGYISAGQGTFAPSFNVDDGTDSHSASTTITVLREDATLMLADDNPVAVGVDSPGGDSVSFALSVSGYETQPDTAASGDAEAGDISLADIRITLVPVGPGGSVSPVNCLPSTTGSGYAGVTTVTCTFASAPVNTYTVEIRTVDDYFVAATEDVLTVFDPSLGFTSGGGWFRWPETGDKTNFGYTMKYNKKGAKVQGSLLMIRHLPDGTKYRVKSNSLEGLALGEDKSVPYGWATFSGKSTYLEPGWADAQGNHGFTVYVEDRDEPGNGTDRIWIENRSKDGATIPAMSLPSAAADHAIQIDGGNIVVPHGSGTGGRR